MDGTELNGQNGLIHYKAASCAEAAEVIDCLKAKYQSRGGAGKPGVSLSGLWTKIPLGKDPPHFLVAPLSNKLQLKYPLLLHY